MRFKEFQGEWEIVKLKNIVQKVSEKNKENKIDIVFSNSATKGIVLQTEYFDKNIANKDNLCGYYIVTPNDFVYNPRISSNAEVGAMSVNHTELTGLVSPLYTVFRIINVDIDTLFLEYIFKSKVWHNYMRSIASYGARDDRMNVKDVAFFDLPLCMPLIREQRKIASLLFLIDERISTQIKIIEKYESLIKGITERLFSQKIRFKNSDGEYFPNWESKKLGEISTITTGSSNREDSILDGEFIFFDRSQDIRTSNRYLFDKEAIIIPGEGQEFKPKYYTGKFDLHQRTYAIFDFVGVVGKYLYYYVSYEDKYLQSQAVGSTVKSLRLPMFQSMPIKLPCIEEQTLIKKFLSHIEEKIKTEKQFLDKLEKQKRYLLQQMFI